MLLLFSVTSHILRAVLLQYYASFDLALATYVALYISDNSAVSWSLIDLLTCRITVAKMAESDDSCSDQEFYDYHFSGSITRYQKDTMTVEQNGCSKCI